MASLNKLPPVLPEINREAWIKLGSLSGFKLPAESSRQEKP
jgi:hypothetical protein